MKKLSLVFLLIFSTLMLFAEEKPKLAVMNFIDNTNGVLSDDLIKSGSKLIRARFIRNAARFYEIVSDQEYDAVIASMMEESRGSERDKKFRLAFGKRISAAKIIVPEITYSSSESKFIITVFLTNVERGTDESSADAWFDGTLKSLEFAVDKIIVQLLDTTEVDKEEAAYYKAWDENSIRGWEKYLSEYKGKNPNHTNNAEKHLSEMKFEAKIAQEESAYGKAMDEDNEKAWRRYLLNYRGVNQVHTEEADKRLKSIGGPGTHISAGMKKDATNLKLSGISLTVIGSVVVAGGVAGFIIMSEKEQDKYNQMTSKAAIQDAINNGMTQSEYLNQANKHKDKSHTYKSLAITCGAVGGAMVITGITLTVLGLQKRHKGATMRMKTASLMPMDNGLYASLGFDF